MPPYKYRTWLLRIERSWRTFNAFARVVTESYIVGCAPPGYELLGQLPLKPHAPKQLRQNPHLASRGVEHRPRKVLLHEPLAVGWMSKDRFKASFEVVGVPFVYLMTSNAKQPFLQARL